MKKIILHKANTRGHAKYDWLDTYHTFSFSNYYDPERTQFGALRVLNDDTIEAGKGFGKHPHDNMEIITIPLEGALEHKDSMGNTSVIEHGEVQVMSAGTGIFHSEYNRYTDQRVKLLQIWVLPRERNITPRYDQLSLDLKDRINKLQQILSPYAHDEGVWIHQDAWFHIGEFNKGYEATYTLKKNGNGLYAFVLKGCFNIEGEKLDSKDGLGIWEIESLKLTALKEHSEILLMEVPM